MYKSLLKYASNSFLYGASLDFFQDQGDNQIRLRIKDFLLKDKETKGIIVDELIMSIMNINDGDWKDSVEKAAYVFEKFRFMIGEDWVNKLIASDDSLGKNGLKDLRVDITPQKIIVLGTIKKGINFSFSVDVKVMTMKGKLVINFDRFWAGDMIPLPQFFQKILLSYLNKYLSTQKVLSKAIRISDQFVLINHNLLIPVDSFIEITDVYSNEHFIIIEGGFDRAKAMDTILKRKVESEEVIKEDDLHDLQQFIEGNLKANDDSGPDEDKENEGRGSEKADSNRDC